jgi:hypothetical protein
MGRTERELDGEEDERTGESNNKRKAKSFRRIRCGEDGPD